MIKTSQICLSLVLGATVISGCQTRGQQPIYRPDPLTPSPTQRVEQNALPAPSQPEPIQVIEPDPVVEDVKQAAVDIKTQAANATAVAKPSLVGSWRAQAGGTSCQMFLTLTKYGNASRGGTRGCSGALTKMRGWDVKGKQLVLYDDGGNSIARLYSSGKSRLDGQTNTGQAVSLSR